VADVVDPNELQLAGRWKRFGGAFLDGLVSMPIILPIAYALGMFNYANRHHQSLADTIVMEVIAFAVFALMQGYFLSKSGQTIGKKVVGTRIVDMEGNPPTLGRLLGFRYAAVYLVNMIPVVGGLLSLLDAVFIFRSDRRCLHDLIAGTQVVLKSPQ
jgi:uncharacterized RDD family membrane protein YckC